MAEMRAQVTVTLDDSDRMPTVYTFSVVVDDHNYRDAHTKERRVMQALSRASAKAGQLLPADSPAGKGPVLGEAYPKGRLVSY